MQRHGRLERRVDRFLDKHGMHPRSLDMRRCVADYLSEMEKGLSGASGSLRMIPTYVDIDGSIPQGKPVVVIDAGGTNFRVATVRFESDGNPIVEKTSTYEMPGTREPIGRIEFFETVARYVSANIEDSDRVGFCFSYPTEILPNRDGRLIRFCKEVRAKEVEGETIGENLNLVLERLGIGKRHIVLLNDTVATLLAGKSQSTSRRYDGFIGFILGTGTNCSYVERNLNIRKLGGLDGEKLQIINVESGSFARMPRGSIDKDFDELTADPGQYTFEKMVSGGYLGALTLKTLQVAASEGLFTSAFAEAIGRIDSLETRQVNLVLRNPEATFESGAAAPIDDDTLTRFLILDRLVERAAKLTAANLASVVLKSEAGKNPAFPVCITAEGTTFYELKSLRERADYFLRDFLTNSMRRYYEFVQVQNATLVGAAIAGLTN